NTGQIVLQAKYFGDIVKKLPGDFIELVIEDSTVLKIMSETACFNLNGLDANEYPQLPKIEEEQVIKIPTDLLKGIIRQTVFAISNSETRPILTGVHLQLENNELICTATDSHRLAQQKVTVQDIPQNTILNVVIPGKSLLELSKILDEKNELVEMVMTDSQVLFKTRHI